MESEQEWQFIKNEIQNKSGNPSNEQFEQRNGLGSMVNL